MSAILVASLMGNNRPGLLKDLAAKTHELGGKWLTSKVNHLDDQISALIKVELPQPQVQPLKDIFNNEPAICAVFSEGEPTPPPSSIVEMVVDSSDRAGIVNEITQVLDSESIELVDMDCQRIGVAELGRSVFTARLMLKVPNSLKSEELAEELEGIADDMVVTVV
ncbi:transcriptional regulator [Neiella marina]|uniref:Glycine cleavage system transcriptional repressor n=1 Tax=Neiella marina TaxID=508461 RepID=A0A8J2XNP6_9GAMM|nr:ACT domain-containing protein [Neiella marina]GGA74895.1 transcriptional regulator [Neiella marina]